MCVNFVNQNQDNIKNKTEIKQWVDTNFTDKTKGLILY